jgi:hypothetical protein
MTSLARRRGALAPLIIAALALAALTGIAAAQTAAAPSAKPALEQSASLYFWFYGSSGTLTSGGISAGMNIEPGSAFSDQSNMPLSFGAHYEVRKGKWGGRVNVFYINADYKASATFQQSDQPSFTNFWVDYSVLYRAYAKPAVPKADYLKEKSPMEVDVYAGGRTMTTKINMTPIVGTGSSTSTTETYPIVGAAVVYPLGPKFAAYLDGNAGGFGVSGVNDAWEGSVLVGWKLVVGGMPSALQLGWKAFDYKLSQTVNGAAHAADFTNFGPVIGFNVHF